MRAAKSFNFVDETQEVVNIYETNSQENGSDNDEDNHKTANTAPHSERPTSSSHGGQASGPNLSPPKNLGNRDPRQVEWTLSLCSPTTENISTSSDIANCIPMLSPSTTSQGDKVGDVALHSSSPENDSSLGFQALLNAGRLLDYRNVCPESLDTPVQPEEDTQWLAETYDMQRRWPLRDKNEAQLFCHYVRNIAPLFDLCDHERHFATVVPQRATTCPPLLNALLAASAKHSCCFGLVSPLVADKYYQESLGTIIPVLSSETVVRDENLLAAIVILRFIEEVDIPFSPGGPQSHLIGTRAFLAARDRTRKFSKLGIAVFWLALRQEIFMALIHSRSVHPDLLIEDIVSPWEPPKCDCDYANRVIVQAALCVQYCFGEKNQQFSTWEELTDALDRWYAERPWQFYPMSAEEENEDQFLPEPKYLSDAVVTGLQHYYMARLILEAHNPTVPKLGPARKMRLKETDQEMKRMVRTICGIAKVRRADELIADCSLLTGHYKANPHTIPSCV